MILEAMTAAHMRPAALAQTAAGSVLGRLVIALAASRGVRTVNLVRRAEQRSEVLALGCVGLECRVSSVCPSVFLGDVTALG